MEILVHFNDVPVTLVTNGFEETVDIDKLTSIDYSNLYGEAVTVSALLNKVGLLRAEAERAVSEKKLEKEVYEADMKKGWRREANRNGGKFTIEDEEIKLSEKALDEALLLDEDYQKLCLEYIEAQKNFSVLDALQWSVQDKSKKLNNLLKPVTPQEFLSELVEGKVNSFLIAKKGFK
jgi:hypothetical protein|nr:MAG TPA: hypothetical protein [Caudoviricetes sp.]